MVCIFECKKTCLGTRIGDHEMRNFSGAISYRTYISDQLQTRYRTRLYYTFEWEWAPSNVHQLIAEEGTRVTKWGSETATHRTKPSLYFASSFSPTGARMSNTASVQAMLRNKLWRANCLPGQILRSSCVAASQETVVTR